MSHTMFVLAPAALRMLSFSAPHLPHWVVHGSMMMRPLGFVPAACQRRLLQPLRFLMVKLTEFPAFSTTSDMSSASHGRSHSTGMSDLSWRHF